MTPFLVGMLIGLLLAIYFKLSAILEELRRQRPAQPRQWKD